MAYRPARRLPSSAGTTIRARSRRHGRSVTSPALPAVDRGEHVDQGEGGGRLFDLGQVTGNADELEPGVGEGAGVGPAVGWRDDAVAVAPEHERRDVDPTEAA